MAPKFTVPSVFEKTFELLLLHQGQDPNKSSTRTTKYDMPLTAGGPSTQPHSPPCVGRSPTAPLPYLADPQEHGPGPDQNCSRVQKADRWFPGLSCTCHVNEEVTTN